MQFAKTSRALACVAVLGVFSAVASADVNDKKTVMTVNERVEIPGAILEPGEYVVKLVDSQSNRHIVRFMNKDEDEVITTVIAIPNMRLEPTGETEFGWYETPAGQPPALRAWFYPGDTFGQEFAYPEDRATELSAATSQEVPSISDEEAATAANQQQEETVVAQTPAPRTTPQATDQTAQQEREREMAAQRERELQAQQERDRETAAQRDREMAAQRERDSQAQRDREREIAQAQDQQRDADQSLTAQQQTEQSQTEGELPATAGLGALLALIGLGTLGASRAVRRLRK